MKKTLFLLWLFLFLTTITAQEFEPPVIIDPPNPQVGDTIRIGLFTAFFPPCLVLPQENQQGETHLFDIDTNQIDLIVVARTVPICNPIPVSPAPREFYTLGTLEAGNYSLETGLVGILTPLPPPINVNPIAYGGVLTFSVTTPQIIDSISNDGLILLIALIFTLTSFFLNKNEELYIRR